MNIKINLISLLSLLLSSVFVFSQQKIKTDGKITGEIVDAEQAFPLIGASVSLHNSSDSSLVKGVYSNSKGKFSLEDINFGDYYLKINYIGYKNKIISSIYINAQKSKYKAGTIKMHPKDVQQDVVEVSGERDFMLNQPDKQIVFVDKNLPAYGGTAADVLKTIPSINVDIDDNINMRTSQNIRFLIDGKQTNMDPADLIEMLPASEIDRIEIITNPSSKYDAEGDVGIVNLVMKKEERNGYRGQINLNAGTGDKYNGALNTSYETGKFGVGLGANYKSNNMFGWSDQTQNNFYNTEATSIVRHQSDLQKKRTGNVRATFDYTLDSVHSFEFIVNYHNSDKSNQKFRNYKLYDKTLFLDYYERDIYNDNLSNKFDYYLNYKLKFNQTGHELDFGGYFSNVNKDYYYDYAHYYYSVSSGVITPSGTPPKYARSSTNNDALAGTVQIDYSLPFSNGSKFEAGYKTNYRTVDMDYKYENLLSNQWVSDTGRTNFFRYNETTHAAYAIYSSKLSDIQYSFGLRGEYTYINSEQLTTNQKNDNSYFDLFPTAYAKYEINPTHSLNLSFTRRINRPKYKDLNPFINYSDPQELSSGNPLLEPELTNALELGYWGIINKTALICNLFYKNTTNSIATIHTLYDSVTVFSKQENFHDINNFGTEFIVSTKVFKQLKIDGSVSFYQSDIVGKVDTLNLSANSFCWNSKLTFYLNFGKKFSIQLSNIYNSPIRKPQIKTSEYITTDLGVKLNILSNKLSLNLKVNDVFNTMKNSNLTDAVYFSVDATRRKETRYIILGLTYNFNNYKEKETQISDDEDSEEIQDNSED